MARRENVRRELQGRRSRRRRVSKRRNSPKIWFRLRFSSGFQKLFAERRNIIDEHFRGFLLGRNQNNPVSKNFCLSNRCGIWWVNCVLYEWIISVINDDLFACSSIPFTSPEDAEIKRCPLCFVPIERADGCAQMMCKRCKHVFCWYCLAPLDVSYTPST